MSKKDILLLIETNPKNDIFYSDWVSNGYNASTLFKKVSKPLRLIRRIWLENFKIFQSIWYEKWFKELDNYSMVILHASNLTKYMPVIISKKYPNLRIICWYWNTVNKKTMPKYQDVKNIEYWSFDENDCKKYNMKYNIQYYCPPKKEEHSQTNYDIYFIGRSKGRKQIINDFDKTASSFGLNCKFVVLEDNDNNVIPYSEVKKEICKTKSLLEINKDNQEGLTLRSLESLFYSVKLITNNKSIIKYDFYNKNNIFIIGADDINSLYDFINTEYDHSVDKYKVNHDLDCWIDNFVRG